MIIAEATHPIDISLQGIISNGFLRDIKQHSALLACPRDAAARESDQKGHGLFTDLILKGLRGAAAGQAGSVGFEQLGTYIARHDIHPPPVFLVHILGQSLDLTYPGRRLVTPRPNEPVTILRPAMTTMKAWNPLDKWMPDLVHMITRSLRDGQWPPAARSGSATRESLRDRIEIVSHAVEATAALLVSISVNSYVVEAATMTAVQLELGPLLQEIVSQMFPFPQGHLGERCVEPDGRESLVVPLSHDPSGSVRCLVIVAPGTRYVDAGEPVITLLTALWRLESRDPVLARFELLTALRRVFGRLPLFIYQDALQVYSQLINSLSMVFEPVVSLNPAFHSVGINAWEALARRNESDRVAPLDLLDAATVWGDQFLVERDRILGVKAIHAFARAHSVSPFAHNAPSPVSINVAVRSLLSNVYANAIDTAIRETGLDQQKVLLEISERDPIESRPNEVWAPSDIEFFQQRLSELVRTIRVGFALDDFGVGESSLDRLANLTLTHIKIDRSILHHPLALDEISLVLRIAKDAVERGHAFVSRSVVVEGYDEHCPVSLQQLYMCGVEAVQGYITGTPATGELRPLGEDLRKMIADMVKGTR